MGSDGGEDKRGHFPSHALIRIHGHIRNSGGSYVSNFGAGDLGEMAGRSVGGLTHLICCMPRIKARPTC